MRKKVKKYLSYNSQKNEVNFIYKNVINTSVIVINRTKKDFNYPFSHFLQ